ncbi:MAG: ABC transporter permease [Acidobacteria bacterium]|nr:ABC transporter permease [Acidobacteriota bacterium]
MKSKIPIIEILRSAHQALLRNWGRTILTSLSMVVGTASLVLVVVTGISGRNYVLELIRGVGTNLIIISNNEAPAVDRINIEDLKAIQTEVPGVDSAAPVVTSFPTITLNGIARGVTLIGTTPEYQPVRNIDVIRGDFIDQNDLRYRNKVCLITTPFAERLEQDPFYEGYVTLYGIRFSVIGVFKERTDTFGNTEVSEYSAIVPLNVVRSFKPDDTIDFIYASAESMGVVPQVSDAIEKLLIKRHRNQDFYGVTTLSEILNAANKISLGLTLVLLVIAAISLIASGISIMNVMLITVTERTREIGVKKSIGAYRRVLLTEFLVEALILSFGGGLVGILLGVATPYSVRFFTTAIKIEIPVIAVVLGFGVTLLVGLTFGMLPALKASRMNPVEALRYE